MFGYDEAPEYDTVSWYDGWSSGEKKSQDRYKEVHLVTTDGVRTYFEHEDTGILTRDVQVFEKYVKAGV